MVKGLAKWGRATLCYWIGNSNWYLDKLQAPYTAAHNSRSAHTCCCTP